ncbi:hypothetical protein CVT25_007064 [Psilocybe cyanescens]|uniref:Uncharacterized protein n=1 Tax=Psilocybe cyanescens TaxID=93625 RepID=A0A409WY79_PSICY|nr:hypothetical protein CVT25_007064 [Psilocybe cyanescens]
MSSEGTSSNQDMPPDGTANSASCPPAESSLLQAEAPTDENTLAKAPATFTVKVQRTRALIRLRSNHYSPLKTLPGENKADIASRPHTTSSLEAEAQAPILAQRLSSVGNTIPLDQTVFLPQPPPDEVDSIPFTFRGERLPSEHALASRIPMTDYAPAKVQAQTLLISQIFAFTPTNTSAIATRQE